MNKEEYEFWSLYRECRAIIRKFTQETKRDISTIDLPLIQYIAADLVKRGYTKKIAHNNFEKWRDSLTVENMVRLLAYNCTKCPNIDKTCAFNCCENFLREWANKECEE